MAELAGFHTSLFCVLNFETFENCSIWTRVWPAVFTDQTGAGRKPAGRKKKPVNTDSLSKSGYFKST